MWRAIYWDAYRNWFLLQHIQATILINKAINLVDSINYEYDYRCIQRLMLNCNADKITYFELYKSYKKLLDYFAKVDDTINIANTCISIGNIFCNWASHINLTIIYIVQTVYIPYVIEIHIVSRIT